MAGEGCDLLGLLDIVLGIATDKAMHDALERVQAAQRAYLIAEADLKRAKVNGIVDAMVSLDIAAKKFEYEYQRIDQNLSNDVKKQLEKVSARLHSQRQELIVKKKMLR